MRVPMERLSVVRNGAECQRTIAREQIDWCRHICVLEDTSHQASTETLYAWHPERVARCTLHREQSNLPSKDWAAVIDTFKKVICQSCSDRSPAKK